MAERASLSNEEVRARFNEITNNGRGLDVYVAPPLNPMLHQGWTERVSGTTLVEDARREFEGNTVFLGRTLPEVKSFLAMRFGEPISVPSGIALVRYRGLHALRHFGTPLSNGAQEVIRERDRAIQIPHANTPPATRRPNGNR